MTTVTAPILAGYTLPHVAADGYHELDEFRGGFTEMASGSISRDLLSTSPKIIFTLDWVTITPEQANDIRSAWAATVVADAEFTSPLGGVYTVQPVDHQPVDVRHFLTGMGVRCDVSLRLRSV